MLHNLTKVILLFGCFTISTIGNTATKPNVIYILADDLGYGDLSSYGQTKFKTPNIDRLAAEGIKFTDHYSGNTVCTPSRAVLLTGQSPKIVHVHGNGAEPAAALEPTMITLPRLFKNAGYTTGAFGKWGLGYTNEKGKQNPLTHGFDHFTGWKSQSIAHTYYPSSIVRDGKETSLKAGTYIHDLIMEDALKFIQQSAKQKKPFFAYIPTAIPHAAMHAPKNLHEKWRKVFPQFDNKMGKYTSKAKDEYIPNVQNPIAGFAAMMEHLDNQVGEILALLTTLNIDDNTLVIFTSDNGAHHEGGHSPHFWNSNGPLRGLKRDLYEGGIRTPMLARWPNHIKPRSITSHISAFWDILPTMAELTHQPLPEQTDGISLVPTLMDQKNQQQHPYLYWKFGKANKPFDQAIRMGHWKALKIRQSKRDKKANNQIQLYNLTTDLAEQHDIASEHPNIVKQLAKYMQ